jgi:3-dehydroquinate synthetase
VDLRAGKNLVGAFKQPSLVVTDPDVLSTLPLAHLRSGLVEIIKAGMIGAPDLFALVEECSHHPGGESAEANADDATRLWDWSAITRRALEVKIRIVEEDPFECGQRAVLNLGHTVGHALELLSKYTLPHGHAVSIGMVAAARLAVATKHAEDKLPERLTALLSRLGLPTALPDHDPIVVWEAMQQDKKRRGGMLRWVLPRTIGDVVVTSAVSRSDVVDVLGSMQNA